MVARSQHSDIRTKKVRVGLIAKKSAVCQLIHVFCACVGVTDSGRTLRNNNYTRQHLLINMAYLEDENSSGVSVLGLVVVEGEKKNKKSRRNLHKWVKS